MYFLRVEGMTEEERSEFDSNLGALSRRQSLVDRAELVRKVGGDLR